MQKNNLKKGNEYLNVLDDAIGILERLPIGHEIFARPQASELRVPVPDDFYGAANNRLKNLKCYAYVRVEKALVDGYFLPNKVTFEYVYRNLDPELFLKKIL